jgi:hypothetical protein
MFHPEEKMASLAHGLTRPASVDKGNQIPVMNPFSRVEPAM